MSEINEFDISAAWMRRAQGDFRAFTEAFAARMEGAFPDNVQVVRHRDSLLSSSRHVHSIAIELGQHTYTLTVNDKRLAATRSQTIRGVTLKSDDLAVADWVTSLNRELQTLATQADSAHTVLHDFLLS